MTSLVYRLLLWIPDTQELNILYLMLERDCPKSYGPNYRRDLSVDFVLDSFYGFLVTQIMAYEITQLSYGE